MSSVEVAVSRTKVIVPALRPEVLRRSRLLARFEELLDKKLILMVAPAGYGKTSLLVDFAHQTEMPVCWLTLDALDKDPQRFTASLIGALAERFPHFGNRSNAVLRTVTSFEQDSERLLTSLVNEIDGQIDGHFVLIVDDYQFVDSIPNVRDLFSRFISLAGENCHVILASRRLPTLPDITLMVARQQVSGFDLEELAFRTEEIRALFEKNYDVKLGEEAAEELVRQTEGWITGLHLSATELMQGAPDPATAVFRASRMLTARATGVDLAVYLDEQVLALQTPELRDFLLKTSLLEEFDADLCEAVLGAGDWKNLLGTVRRNNLFVLPIGPQGKWLRYHHLFKEFLQERIQQESPETAHTILALLMGVYEKRGEWEKAHALTRQLGDLEALAGLVERIGTIVLTSEHLITVQSWLDEFPGATLEKRPALLSLKGALLCGLGDGRAAIPLLDRSIDLSKRAGDLPGLPLTLVRRAAARRLAGDYAGAVQDADEALRLADTAADRESVSAEAQRFKGICLFRLGQAEEAVTSLGDSLRRYELLDDVINIARLQMDLGWVYHATGKYAAAAQFYQKAMEEWKRENNLYSQTNALNYLSVLHYMQGDYELAVRAQEDGLACARQGGFRWQEALLLASLGDVLCDLDEYESAQQTYDTATRLAQQVSYQFLVNYLSLAQVRLARLRGRFKEAHSLLQESRPMIQAGGSNYEFGLLFLESGCLSLAEANLQLALSELSKALDQFQRGALKAEAEWSRVWLAAADARSGNEVAAREALRSLTATLSQYEGDLPLVHMLRHAMPWLADLQPDLETDSLFKRVALAEERIPGLRKRLRRMMKNAPLQDSRLTILTLGKPQVRVNGKLISLSHWQTLSVRDLFFFFLLSPLPVTKDEICEALWPELESFQLKLRFKNNLYRLRHAVGQDAILFENNQYFFNRYIDYEYDVEEFDARLQQAKTAERIEDKIVHLQAATRLWHGPYLNGVDTTWTWPERQRLEHDYLEALRQLAELHRQAGNIASALDACKRALALNSCLEEFHRLAMRLHAEQGDRLEVIRQYQACGEALKSELGIAPSAETQALYQRLKS